MQLEEFKRIQNAHKGSVGYHGGARKEWTIVVRIKDTGYSEKEDLSVFKLNNASQEDVVLWMGSYFKDTIDTLCDTFGFSLEDSIESITQQENIVHGILNGYWESEVNYQEDISAYSKIASENYEFEEIEL